MDADAVVEHLYMHLRTATVAGDEHAPSGGRVVEGTS
jgi:hypothetical protein